MRSCVPATSETNCEMNLRRAELLERVETTCQFAGRQSNTGMDCSMRSFLWMTMESREASKKKERVQRSMREKRSRGGKGTTGLWCRASMAG